MAESNQSVRARLHPKLQKFLSDVKRGFLEKTYEVGGLSFKLRTPNDDAETWADTFIKQSTVLSYVSSRRSPRLACAIVEIDGTPVDKMFEKPEGMKDDDWDRLNSQPEQKRYWLWGQMLVLLSSDIPPPVVTKLYTSYEDLIQERDNALKDVFESGPNSSTKTPGSESAPT